MDFISILPILIPVIVIIAILIILALTCVKTAKGNEALVVSGIGATDKNGNPKIIRAGGKLVWPFIQRAEKFDCCIRTADTKGDITKTTTGVPIRLDWAVAYSPDTSSQESLQKAVVNFLDKDENAFERIVKDIVSGGVRAVISRMTPEAVMKEKDQLDDEVKKSISSQMRDLGLSVTLSIHEVEDADGSTYYKDLAAPDRETKRKEAANISAQAEQSIRETKAKTDQAAKEQEIAAEVAVAERRRDADIKQADFKAETDRKKAQAEQATALEQETIKKELAIRTGAVAVEEQTQANLAAQERRKVAVTEAETAKQTAIIKAQTAAEEKKTQATGEAEAKKASATGEAEAKKAIAAGEAEAKRLSAAGEADAIRARGLAEADATKAKGEAEADAIRAKGLAEADAARQLSDAQAANDRVNFELQKLEIQEKARVEIATNVGKAMAEVGKNATFYDFGGSRSEESGDILTGLISRIPQVIAKANLQNEALNGTNLNDTLRALIGAISDGVKGNQPDTALPASDESPTSSTKGTAVPPTMSKKPSASDK
ncbi:hypothetical protein IKG31_02440 [Candidatus Saccharibacteria bacterium]|nr:hypothetical protein [Candidatus Saccharibacteria bacterium]